MSKSPIKKGTIDFKAQGKRNNQKGKRNEREAAALIRLHGFHAERGRQYQGGSDSPDIKTELPIHFEIKSGAKINLKAAYKQATTEAPPAKTPVVMYKVDRDPWMVNLRATSYLLLWERLKVAEDWINKFKADLPDEYLPNLPLARD